MKFVGCKKAKEVSLTQDPAQPLAMVLVRKDAGRSSSPDPSTETDDMDFKSLQRVASMSDVTKSFFAALPSEEAVKTFLAKPAAEQDAEAEAAKTATEAEAAKSKAAADAAAALSGDTSEAVKALTGQNAEMRKELDDLRQERDIEKQAASADFVGYPGGPVAVAEVLKTAFSVSGAARDKMIDMAKSQAALARTTRTERGVLSDHDVLREAPATSEVQKEASDRAAKNGTTAPVELIKMAKEPAWAAKVDAALEEEAA